MAAYVAPRRIASSASTITVIAAGTSALMNTVNGGTGSGYEGQGVMASNSWRQHLTATGQNTALQDPTSATEMLVFYNTAPWNPIAKRIEVLGKGHGDQTRMRYSVFNDQINVYSATQNTFSFIRECPDIDGWNHNWDHSCVNPYTGELFQLENVGYGSGGPTECKKKSVGINDAFVAIPDGPSKNEGVAIGACWWSGAFTPVGFPAAGAQGCLMRFCGETVAATSATYGNIIAFDPLASGGVGSWFYDQNSRGPGGGGDGGTGNSYQMVIEYNPVSNCAVYGGGNYNSRELWTMNQNGVVTSFQTYPAENMPSGLTINAGTTGGKLVDNPANGNFLQLSNGQLWEINPTLASSGAAAWTQKTGTGVPPSSALNPDLSANNGSVVPVSIRELGIMVVLCQASATNGTMWIYKP